MLAAHLKAALEKFQAAPRETKLGRVAADASVFTVSSVGNRQLKASFLAFPFRDDDFWANPFHRQSSRATAATTNINESAVFTHLHRFIYRVAKCSRQGFLSHHCRKVKPS